MKKKILAIILTVLFIFSLVSCSSKNEMDRSGYETYSEINEISTSIKRSSVDIDESGLEETDSKIVKTATINAETLKFDDAYKNLYEKVSELGGRFSKSSITNRGSYYLNDEKYNLRYATFTIRIPADKFDGFINGIDQMYSITSIVQDEVDKTAEYVDVEARLKTMKTQEAALQAMLEKATNVSEMLTIQSKLYDVIADCEAYEAQLKQIDDKVSYSTITLYVTEVREYTYIEDETFFSKLGEAFSRSWKNFVNGLGDFVVFIVGAIPTLLVIAVIVVIIVITIKGCKNKKRKKLQKAYEKSKQNATEENSVI